MRLPAINNSFWAIIVPVVVVLWLFFQFRIAGEGWKHVIDSDGRGYYHYLIEYFVDNDYRNVAEERSYLAKTDDVYYNRYTLGTALLLSPFFGLGYTLAETGGFRPDGYSWPFQVMAGIGALFYLIIGAILLYKLMRSYCCSKKLAWSIALITVFGTNLLYYGVVGSTMSHVYSFAAISALAVTTRFFFLSGNYRYLLLAGVLYGFVLLIRPFNGLVIFALPLFFADRINWKTAVQKVFNARGYVLLAAVISVLIFVPQVIAWHQQSGKWILYGYSKMGFYFSDPQIYEVLMGFNKGLFVYTPLIALPVIASVTGFWKQPLMMTWFLAFFFLITYLISSWWCWNYASGFGMRPFIDFYAIFAIPVALVFRKMAWKNYWWVVVPVIGLTILNLIQSYQYRTQILHPNNMDFEKYKHVFLKTGEPYEGILGGSFDLPPYSKYNLVTIDTFKASHENQLFTDEFGYTQQYDGKSFPNEAGFIHWDIELKKSDPVPRASNKLHFVVEYSNGDSTTIYKAFKVNDIPDYPVDKTISHHHSLTIRMPRQSEIVKFYLWNMNLQPQNIHQFNVAIMATATE